MTKNTEESVLFSDIYVSVPGNI